MLFLEASMDGKIKVPAVQELRKGKPQYQVHPGSL
jgi:hypothetical protein